MDRSIIGIGSSNIDQSQHFLSSMKILGVKKDVNSNESSQISISNTSNKLTPVAESEIMQILDPEVNYDFNLADFDPLIHLTSPRYLHQATTTSKRKNPFDDPYFNTKIKKSDQDGQIHSLQSDGWMDSTLQEIILQSIPFSNINKRLNGEKVRPIKSLTWENAPLV